MTAALVALVVAAAWLTAVRELVCWIARVVAEVLVPPPGPELPRARARRRRR